MFRTLLTELIVFYLLAVLGLLFAIWIAREWWRKRRTHAEQRHRYLCRVCGEIFENDGRSEIIHCPACDARNERDPIREF
ncbi:MAG: hypothetical protein R3F11_13225 [Verrucomicrobiales bacterium]